MEQIHIEASQSYDVLIGKGLLESCGTKIRSVTDAQTVMLVSDDRVYPLYGDKVRKTLENAGLHVLKFVFPHGEQSKNLSTYGSLLETMCQAHLTRKDAAVALGGGVTGDLTGFAAATYQRGIDFIQLPTTLLAAVDSSVGGKTAVNLENGKNQVGCFYQPKLVLCDTDTLSTLSEAEYRCGCAEILKYGMLQDAAFLENLLDTPVREQTEAVIAHCVQMKRDFVRDDEFDRGKRMLLNFGHTFGHAAEACSGYQLLHGDGVAMGMATITRAAVKRGICDAETLQQLLKALKQYSLPYKIPYPLEKLKQATLSDKKSGGGRIQLIVPESVGKCRVEAVPTAELEQWMKDGEIQ